MRLRVSIRDVHIEVGNQDIFLPTLPDAIRELDDDLTSLKMESFSGIHWLGETFPKIEIRWEISMTVKHFQRVLDSNPEFDSAIFGMSFDSSSGHVKAYVSGVLGGGDHTGGGENAQNYPIKGWIGFFVER